MTAAHASRIAAAEARVAAAQDEVRDLRAKLAVELLEAKAAAARRVPRGAA